MTPSGGGRRRAPRTKHAAKHASTNGIEGETSERFQRGMRAFREIAGRKVEEAFDPLAGIAPNFSRYAMAFFGDVYTRPGLDRRSRQIATISALMALGTAPSQLRFHIEAGLNVGLTREQIVEVITQLALYVGAPAAGNAFAAAADVFASRPGKK
jgi:4-carboxymuconolactone decarboxylase